MEFKNIVASIYLKNGEAVKSLTDYTPAGDVFQLAKYYNDCGVDKIYLFDLSNDEVERQLNLTTMRHLNRNLDIKTCAAGNINHFDDIKNVFYSGCLQVMLNGSKPESIGLAEKASKKFGKDRVLVSVKNVNFIFKNKEAMEENSHEMLVFGKDMLDAVENITSIPSVVIMDELDEEEMLSILKRDSVRGVTGTFVSDPQVDIMRLKAKMSDNGIHMVKFAPALQWSDFKLNSDGMVPVIVQDYRTNEILMLAYMNEESYECTINSGKMTYYSRSRNQLWVKGETSGHFQFVKSLTADCDYDTILAKVSQSGPACHTGSQSCFFNSIVKKEYVEKNPLKVFDKIYAKIIKNKENNIEDAYSNVIIQKGMDEILKKITAENTELLLAAKNSNQKKITHEISDYLYNLMLLMVETGVTWEDIAQELSQR